MTETHPQTRRLGCSRISTYGQTLDAQLELLKVQGCTRTYREKASGAQVDRHELQRCAEKLYAGRRGDGDAHSHLARSTLDLFAIVKRNQKHAPFLPTRCAA